MPVLTDDLVHQTSTTTGTGAKALVDVNGRRGFEDVFGDGGTDVFYYYISNRDAAEWEFGSGHIDGSGDLVADTVIKSSNGNAAVNFSAGTKDITSDWPASKQCIYDRELFDGVSLCALARALSVGQFAGDRFADSFGALTYVDTAGATNLDSGTTGVLKPTISTTDYGNTGGTGDRTASITVTTTLNVASGTASNLVDGGTGNNTTDSLAVTTAAAAGVYIRFDFGSGASKVIQEARWKQSSTDSHGTWKWQGSNNGSEWFDIGSSFTFGGATTQTMNQLSGNTTGYRYYQIVGVSGNYSQAPWYQEMEFKIADAPLAANNLIVASNGITPVNTVNTIVIVARVKHVDSAAAGTDYNFTVSRNGGSDYSGNLTLHDRFTDPSDSCHVIESDPIDVSGQATPSTIKWQFTTANNKNVELRDIYFRAAA